MRRAVAVELETTKELNKLLYSVETMYLNIVREVVEYAIENNVTNPTQLQRLFYSKYRQKYPSLNSSLIAQAIRQAAQIAKLFIERRSLADKSYPEVKTVSIRFTEMAWNYEQFASSIAPVRIRISPISTGKRGRASKRLEVWLRLHKRFWLYWWRVLRGEAELASTLIIKRKTNKWYVIFIFKLKPREEEPQSIIAFDINENTVAVGKINIETTVGKVVDWNRQYLMPQLYMIRTDFGRLARRYEAIRNAITERLKPLYALPNGKYVSITDVREFRKRVKHLREKDRKLGRVRHVASELTKTPGIIITEELGDNPQESMINGIGEDEVRHRIKQIPFKKLEKAVEDKALERGSKLFHVSSYRNSRVCPMHFTRLGGTNDWHVLYCPKSHYVNRDYASVMNMAWKITPEAWVKGVWWDLKREKMNWKVREGDSNPIIPQNIVQLLWLIMRNTRASFEQSPAVLARGTPMNPARGANEGWGRVPSRSKEVPPFRAGRGQNLNA